MENPSIPIKVDPDTGIWSTNGLPMIYMPRHFFVNAHFAAESALTEEIYARQLYAAGHKSAWFWCEKESEAQRLSGIDVFHHYIHSISQRGWGQFSVMSLDESSGAADIRLKHSVFVEHCGTNGSRNLCYMYSGWFAGSLEWAGQASSQCYSLVSYEASCAANGAEHCLFKIRPR